MDINYKMLGSRIKAKRSSVKKTQEQAAEFLNVSVSYISQIERGVTKVSLDTLAKLAGFIETDIAELITGTSVTDKRYMFAETNSNMADLSPKERQMLNDFMKLLKNNR